MGLMSMPSKGVGPRADWESVSVGVEGCGVREGVSGSWGIPLDPGGGSVSMSIKL